MDGFSENCNIVVIAATNREQLLDKALIRSGRFDTKIKVGLPDEKDRLGVLDIHMKHVIFYLFWNYLKLKCRFYCINFK